MSNSKGFAAQIGLGRAAYRLVFEPLGHVRQTWREGGPIEQHRTRLGHRAMTAAAASLLPLVPRPEPLHKAEVAFLTGPRFWDQTLLCFVSLQHCVPYRVTPVIYDDGKLDPETTARLLRVVPWARIVSATESDARLDRHLPEARYPALRQRRANFPLMRKLLDVHAGSNEFRMFADSDMLFFRQPSALMDWFADPHWFYLQDCVTSYGYPRSYLDEIAGSDVPEAVNSGLYAINGAEVDWDRLEYWCARQLSDYGAHYLQEQTLTAMLFAGRSALVLPREDYVVMPDDAEGSSPRAVLHHYVALSKKHYFRANWRRVIA